MTGKTVYIIDESNGIRLVKGIVKSVLEDGSISVENTDYTIVSNVEYGNYFDSLILAREEALKRIKERAKAQIDFINKQYEQVDLGTGLVDITYTRQ